MDSVYERLQHLNVKFKLIKQKPIIIAGVTTTTEEVIGEFFANCQTYGGTATVINGITTYENTGEVTTYYRTDITQDCKVVNLFDNGIYEIISEPENYLYENKALIFKIRRLKGKFNA